MEKELTIRGQCRGDIVSTQLHPVTLHQRLMGCSLKQPIWWPPVWPNIEGLARQEAGPLRFFRDWDFNPFMWAKTTP